ncbi:hypothetical protein X777_08688, partial [Ooceraea biroi]
GRQAGWRSAHPLPRVSHKSLILLCFLAHSNVDLDSRRDSARGSRGNVRKRVQPSPLLCMHHTNLSRTEFVASYQTNSDLQGRCKALTGRALLSRMAHRLLAYYIHFSNLLRTLDVRAAGDGVPAEFYGRHVGVTSAFSPTTYRTHPPVGHPTSPNATTASRIPSEGPPVSLEPRNTPFHSLRLFGLSSFNYGRLVVEEFELL